MVADPDGARRARFVARAVARLAPVPGLPVRQLEVGNVVVCWAAAPRAPVSTYQRGAEAAVAWGDALRRGGRARVTAEALLRAWIPAGASAEVFDGFHAGVAVREDEVVLGGDLLGLFPWYHAHRGEVQLAASAAAVLALHPSLGTAVDARALLGYLLIGGPFDGRTLATDVRRLPAGAVLRWHAAGTAREERRYQLPSPGPSAPSPRAPLGAAVERLGAALEQAVTRHAGVHDDLAVLLSGGRDSRLIAGYLARANRSARAVSIGRPDDHDASCAARVARVLDMPHAVRDIAMEDFPGFADASVRWEQLAGGMSNVHSWGNGAAVGKAGGVLAGYLMEVRQLAPLPAQRDRVLAWSHGHAMTPDALSPLLQEGPMRALLDEVRHDIAVQADAAGIAQGCTWQWRIATYGRFHAGAVPWRLSFTAWPVLPILDQELLATLFALPEPVLANRRAQEALLRARFPALARLPLDRNAHDTRPLAPSWPDRARGRVRRLVQRLGPAAPSAAPAGDAPGERRYYYRMYDFDNAGWRAIRRAAEPGRACLGAWIDPHALRAVVPPPDVRAAHADPIADGFASRMLAGMMRWCLLRQGAGR